MIAFINTPIQGASVLLRELRTLASLSTPQNNIYLSIEAGSFHDANDSIFAINDKIIDVNEKLSQCLPASLYAKNSLNRLTISIKASTHDVLYVIKGAFYHAKSTRYTINEASSITNPTLIYIIYAPTNALMLLNVFYNFLNITLIAFHNIINPSKVINNDYCVCKDASSIVLFTYHAQYALFYAIKYVSYVIKELIYVIKVKLNENKEVSMRTRKEGGYEDGTCNEAIMRG